MNQEQITKNVERFVAMANSKFNANLTMPKVEFPKGMGITAGQASINSNTLKFNIEIAKTNVGFENTISHEVAHLVVSKVFPKARQFHGPEFRMVHMALGGDGKTYHNYNLENVQRKLRTRHVAKCSCTEHLITTVKANQIKTGRTNFSCNHCKVVISLTGKTKKV